MMNRSESQDYNKLGEYRFNCFVKLAKRYQLQGISFRTFDNLKDLPATLSGWAWSMATKTQQN